MCCASWTIGGHGEESRQLPGLRQAREGREYGGGGGARPYGRTKRPGQCNCPRDCQRKAALGDRAA